jgi:CDP-diglyceride synthetase
MNDNAPSKQATIIARTIAVLVAAAGAYFIYIIVSSFLKNSIPLKNATDFIFLFVFPLPIFIAMGIYCIYSGYRLWFKISSENTRRISFVTAIIVFLLLIWAFSYLLKSDKLDGLLTPLLMIPAGIFFLFFNRSLARWLNLPTVTDWTRREKSTKRYFGWLAFFLFSSSLGSLNIYLPPEKYTFLILPLFIGTIVLAYAVYKLGVAIALRNKPKESEIPAALSIPAASNPGRI